jgi:hypothetical protein
MLAVVIIYQLLQRTSLGSGATAIAMVFGAITFVALFANPSLIQVLVGVYAAVAIIVILGVLLLIPTKRGTPFAKLLIVILMFILLYLLIANNHSLGNSINNALGFNFVAVLPVIVVASIVLGIIVLLLRAFKTTRRPGIKVFIPIIILGLLGFFFLPGFGMFILSPVGLFIVAVIVGILFFLFAVLWRSGGVSLSSYSGGSTDSSSPTSKYINKKPGWGSRSRYVALNQGRSNPPPPPPPSASKDKDWVVPMSYLSDKKTHWYRAGRNKEGKVTGKSAGTASNEERDKFLKDHPEFKK